MVLFSSRNYAKKKLIKGESNNLTGLRFEMLNLILLQSKISIAIMIYSAMSLPLLFVTYTHIVMYKCIHGGVCGLNESVNSCCFGNVSFLFQ